MTLLKFRAWWKAEKVMIDSISWLDFKKGRLIGSVKGQTTLPLDFDKVELMQCTGMTDTMDNDIFENDIITVDRGDYLDYGRVSYNVNCAKYVVEFDGEILPLGDVAFDYVAGNVYENPELLDKVGIV